MDALVLHRIQFAFTITYHYLFPQLTMGLALLIVVLKTLAIRTNRQVYHDSARFWATATNSRLLPPIAAFGTRAHRHSPDMSVCGS